MRKCFFSFHYEPDSHRASLVRNIGAVEGSRVVSPNEWEAVTRGGDAVIANWISAQMEGRTCVVVLVGATTAGRKWINHEIVQGWNARKGVVGIRIHGLKNLDGEISKAGANPFDHVRFEGSGKLLSSVVKCYDPVGTTSKERYAWIKENLANKIEEAVRIRTAFGSRR